MPNSPLYHYMQQGGRQPKWTNHRPSALELGAKNLLIFGGGKSSENRLEVPLVTSHAQGRSQSPAGGNETLPQVEEAEGLPGARCCQP